MQPESHTTASDTDPPELRAAIASARKLTTGGHVPGLSLAVTSHDRLLYSAAFGHSDLRNGRPATPATSFLWFSMSKIATATAALRLADEGRLELDTPIADLVPQYGKTADPVPRVGHLLDHTAGVANPVPIRWVRPANQPAPDSQDFLARRLARHGQPKYPIGRESRYSNLGYLILAEAVAQVSGQPFEDYVREAVLVPAGMTRTGYTYAPGVERAVGYVRAPRFAGPVLRAALPGGIVGERHGAFQSFRPFLVNGAGYGGLVGDVVDAAKLVQLHLADGTRAGQRVLSTARARTMREIHSPGKPFDLGQGWIRKPEHAHATPSFVEHPGSGGGFFNAIRLYPDQDLGMVVMANATEAYNFDGLFDLLRRVPWIR